MIQIAAPAPNVPNATGRPAPVTAGEGMLAFLLPGVEAGALPEAVAASAAGVEAPAGERQGDAAPGSDLPEGASDDLRFLAALLPGVPLPVAPEAKPESPVTGSVPVSDRPGPKGERWTLPVISTVKPQPLVAATDAPPPTLPVPDRHPVSEDVVSTPPVPAPAGAPPPVAPPPAKVPGSATETLSPAVPPDPVVATPIAVAPRPAAAPSTPPAPIVMAARTMVAEAIRAGVRIEPVPLPAAPVLPLAPIALPANWQAQAAPVVALASPVPLAAPLPLPTNADPVPVAASLVEGTRETARAIPSVPLDPRPTPTALPQPLAPAGPDLAAAPGLAALTAAIPPAGSDRDPADPADPLAAIAPAAAAQPVAGIAPANGGERSMLDLTQERWPQAMVAHIERLRDAADAADTRIRLVPDALGAIDIGVRQEGETLHVHFTAAEAQTRTLLQEAQPRLAEAAEHRGLKLGQTSVGQNQADASAGQRQPHSQPQHQAVPSPRPAPQTRTASTRDGDDDARLA